jgi:hypothetical protein
MNGQTPDPEAVDALLRRAAKTPPAGPAKGASPPADAASSALAARIAAQVLAAQARERTTVRSRRADRDGTLGTWAAAAALVLAVAIGSQGQQPLPLPDYSIEVSGAEQTLRSAGTAPMDSEVLKVSPGSRLRINARPAQRVAEPVSAELWRGSPAGPVLVALPIQVSSSGAIQLDAPVRDALLPAPGAQRLWMVLSSSQGARLQPASLPSIDTSGHYGPSYVLPINLELQPQ